MPPDNKPLKGKLVLSASNGAKVRFSDFALKASSHVLKKINANDGIDLVEICGGEARASTLALRRHIKTGQNFVLVCNVTDLWWLAWQRRANPSGGGLRSSTE